jgi:hypothetical protein
MDADPLDIAEKLTGKSYKEDEETSSLGMLLQFSKTKILNKLLIETNDTIYGMKVSQYLDIATSSGFRIVLELPFDGNVGDNHQTYNEMFYILFHDKYGILLTVETYGETSVNSSHSYYNWIPNDIENYHLYISSGGFNKNEEKNIWIGNHDGREGLLLNIRQLAENGTFLTPWVERPWLWLLNYVEAHTNADDYKEINQKILNLLPEDVRKLLAGNT